MLRGPSESLELARHFVQEKTHGYDSNIPITKGTDDLEASDFFTMNPRETRDHGLKIMKQPSRLNLRKFSLSHRVVDDWKSLLSKVVEARDVEQFKAELGEEWEDIRFLHTAIKPQMSRESDLKKASVISRKTFYC